MQLKYLSVLLPLSLLAFAGGCYPVEAEHVVYPATVHRTDFGKNAHADVGFHIHDWQARGGTKKPGNITDVHIGSPRGFCH
ncbi:MAG: hypothetical protein ABIG30_03710 [Candidatus Aenigmatarchaeota archaeon]